MESKDRNAHLNLMLALCLIATGVSLRLLPHPANFAPVAAVAIFGGAVLPRRLAVWVPVAAMILSDALIGFYSYKIMFVVWASYLLIAFASSHWLRQFKLKNGILLTVSGSIFFFLATNFAVWLWGGMYARTWTGIAQCYTAALPFFRNTLLSDLFYTVMLFSVYALATRTASRRLLNTNVNSQIL